MIQKTYFYLSIIMALFTIMSFIGCYSSVNDHHVFKILIYVFATILCYTISVTLSFKYIKLKYKL